MKRKRKTKPAKPAKPNSKYRGRPAEYPFDEWIRDSANGLRIGPFDGPDNVAGLTREYARRRGLRVSVYVHGKYLFIADRTGKIYA